MFRADATLFFTHNREITRPFLACWSCSEGTPAHIMHSSRMGGSTAPFAAPTAAAGPR
jgi:hypothetical protein